jgi:hypothetical protein
MGSLAEVQAWLADVLRRPTSLVEDPLLSREAERVAAGNDRLSPIEQVDIYREQFWLRHFDCLRDDFASIEHAIGEDAFRELVRAYLAAYPSASYTLRDLGEHMVAFLRETPPWSEDRFIIDLARVEWAFVEAFDGPDAPPFDPSSIEGRSEDEWPCARVVLHPSLQRLALASAAHDYRIGVHKKESPQRPPPQPYDVVIYRGPEVLHCLEVERDAALLLDELERGVPLGEACECAARASGTDIDAFQPKLAGWFAKWASLGWIRAVEFPSSSPVRS